MGRCHGDARQHHLRKHIFWGATLLSVGTVYLLANQGVIASLSAWLLLPIFLGVSGVIRLWFARRVGQRIRAGLHVLLALWLAACLEQLWGWTFHSTWPVALILIGAATLTRSIFGHCQPVQPEPTP